MVTVQQREVVGVFITSIGGKVEQEDVAAQKCGAGNVEARTTGMIIGGEIELVIVELHQSFVAGIRGKSMEPGALECAVGRQLLGTAGKPVSAWRVGSDSVRCTAL